MMMFTIVWILTILLLTGPAQAQEYLIQHWFVGRVQNSADGAALADGRQVHIHYGGDEATVGQTTVAASGQYQIDINELDPNWFTINEPRTVNVLVHHPPPPLNYGAGPVPMILNRAATQNVDDMQLALGGGWADPAQVVVSRIERVPNTNDIRVSWVGPATVASVDIFRLRPTGAYAGTLHDQQIFFDPHQSAVDGSTWNWEPVATMVARGASYTEENQIGAGFPQAYYKVIDNAFRIPEALADGILLTAEQRDAFQDTEAVGKYDFLLENGYSLLSFPIIPFDTTIAGVFGTQLNGLSPNIFGYTAGLGLRRGYMSGTDWQGPIVNDGIHPDRGYWLSVNLPTADPRRVTIIGEVASGPRSIALAGAQSSLIGNSLPFHAELANATHSNLAAALENNDSIYGFVFDRTTHAGGLSRGYRTGGGFGGPLSTRGIEPGKGYWVIKGSAGASTLTINRRNRNPL